MPISGRTVNSKKVPFYSVMDIQKTSLDGVLVLRPRLFKDGRGWFQESYNRDTFQAAGLTETFVQDNHSRSIQHTLRGLHFQTEPGQAKLIRCTLGKIWDVAVDIRPRSRTFGLYMGMELSAEDPAQLLIPVGFAHGFLVLSDWAEVQYKCSNVYNGATEAGIQWDDGEVRVPWPLGSATPLLSERDKKNQSFAEYRARLGV
jgi:dTDP-4-dehydrorhamnose 3,5-epimerase